MGVCRWIGRLGQIIHFRPRSGKLGGNSIAEWNEKSFCYKHILELVFLGGRTSESNFKMWTKRGTKKMMLLNCPCLPSQKGSTRQEGGPPAAAGLKIRTANRSIDGGRGPLYPAKGQRPMKGRRDAAGDGRMEGREGRKTIRRGAKTGVATEIAPGHAKALLVTSSDKPTGKNEIAAE